MMRPTKKATTRPTTPPTSKPKAKPKAKTKVLPKAATGGVENLGSTFHTHLRNAGNKQWPGAFTTPTEASGNVRQHYSTGLPPLNCILSGNVLQGMCGGKIAEVFGDYDVGKTTLGLQVCKSVQDAGGAVVIFDTESTLSADRMKALGLDTERVTVIEESRREIIFDQIQWLLQAFESNPGIIFLDTYSSTKSVKDDGKKTGEGKVAASATVAAEGLRNMVKTLAKSNTLLLVNQQQKTGGIGQYFAPERERNATMGGKAFKFHALQSVRIDGYKVEKAKASGGSGFVVTATVVKSKQAAKRVACTLAFDTSSDPATFDVPRSIHKTLVKWGAANSKGQVVIDKRGHTERQFAKKYNTDAAFKTRAHDLLQKTYEELA